MQNSEADDPLEADMEEAWQVVASQALGGDTIITHDQWRKAITILVEKPQSVDRRVSGQVSLGRAQLSVYSGSWPRLAGRLAALLAPATWDGVEEVIKQDSSSSESCTATVCECSFVLQRMVSKNASRHPDYVRLVAMSETSCLFLSVGSSEPHPYQLLLR